MLPLSLLCALFFFNDTATTEIYTLSLHDALPISFVSGHSHRSPNRKPRTPWPGRAGAATCSWIAVNADCDRKTGKGRWPGRWPPPSSAAGVHRIDRATGVGWRRGPAGSGEGRGGEKGRDRG